MFRREAVPGLIQSSYPTNFINPALWVRLLVNLEQASIKKGPTFSVALLSLIKKLNRVSCLGQASNTSDYTSRVYVRAARANSEESSDVEATACALKAPGKVE